MVHIHSPREIHKIAESCQIVADTLDMLEDHIKPGVTLVELDTLAEEYIRSRNARPAFKGYLGFPASLCISIDSEVVHGIPSKRRVKNGQILSVDCGVEKDGYFGDAARSFAVGQLSDQQKELMRVTYESLILGIEQARDGNYVSDIGHAIQKHVEAHGFSVVRELVGHGIGSALHEDPPVPNFGRPHQGERLRVGMCLAIEPMINLGRKDVYTAQDGWTVLTSDGKASAHFEHTIVIKSEGPHILTKGKNGG